MAKYMKVNSSQTKRGWIQIYSTVEGKLNSQSLDARNSCFLKWQLKQVRFYPFKWFQWIFSNAMSKIIWDMCRREMKSIRSWCWRLQNTKVQSLWFYNQSIYQWATIWRFLPTIWFHKFIKTSQKSTMQCWPLKLDDEYNLKVD